MLKCLLPPPVPFRQILGASEITENLYCNYVDLYWEGCVICSIYLRLYMKRLVYYMVQHSKGNQDFSMKMIEFVDVSKCLENIKSICCITHLCNVF